MEAGHSAGVVTRHSIIRHRYERRGAGRSAWYQIPRLMTQSPLAALLPQRALSRDSTNMQLSHRLSCLARPPDTVLRLVAGCSSGAVVVRCVRRKSRGQGAVTGGWRLGGRSRCQRKMPFILPIR
jgi:hypothetical protein